MPRPIRLILFEGKPQPQVELSLANLPQQSLGPPSGTDLGISFRQARIQPSVLGGANMVGCLLSGAANQVSRFSANVFFLCIYITYIFR